MLSIGIDPGLSSGKLAVAILDGEDTPNLHQLGVNTSRAKGIVRDYDRCVQVRAQLNTLLNETLPGVIGERSVMPCIAVEAPLVGFPGKRRTRSAQTGMLHFAVYEALSRYPGCTVLTVANTVLKKCITGKGNADKQLVTRTVQSLGYSVFSDDLADAIGLALIAGSVASGKNSNSLSYTVDEILQVCDYHSVQRGGYNAKV